MNDDHTDKEAADVESKQKFVKGRQHLFSSKELCQHRLGFRTQILSYDMFFSPRIQSG